MCVHPEYDPDLPKTEPLPSLVRLYLHKKFQNVDYFWRNVKHKGKSAENSMKMGVRYNPDLYKCRIWSKSFPKCNEILFWSGHMHIKFSERSVHYLQSNHNQKSEVIENGTIAKFGVFLYPGYDTDLFQIYSFLPLARFYQHTTFHKDMFISFKVIMNTDREAMDAPKNPLPLGRDSKGVP